jgi:peptidoglycan/xylan/chitin deacetylase (PgdA/CDA1 family)
MLTRTATNHGLILLYHFVSDEGPEVLSKTVHIISPSTLENHLSAIGKAFRFVTLETFSATQDKSGLAAVTFDDGYRNVITNALPLMERLEIPFTLFLNPVTFSGRWNWRDKVRFVIAHDLVDDFRSSFDLKSPDGRFYRDSKHPGNNSAMVDNALDQFIGSREIDIYGEYPYARIPDFPTEHPLVCFGNHSFSHYVLSSLGNEIQHQEIADGAAAMREICGGGNGIFSVPFGGDCDLNPATREIAGALGYHTLLMSRQKLQPGHASGNGLQILERFMPRSDDIEQELGRCMAVT